MYIWPVGDSANPYYVNPKFVAKDREVYSLFVAGQIGSTTGLLIKDEIPYYTDSTFGVRFINLIPNSPPLNVTLSTITPSVNEVSNLGYLQYTDFKIYPGKAANTSYTFQVRKASDNSIVASFTLSPVPRFANVTLVIKGMIGGTGTAAPGMFRINNDR